MQISSVSHSLPYISIFARKSPFCILNFMFCFQVKIRDSKYGHALVIQTLDTSSGYTLGFRVDPASRLVEVYKELDSLFSVYSVNPIFGVTYERKKVFKCIF